VLWLSAARSERFNPYKFNPYKPVTLIAFMCEGIACTDAAQDIRRWQG